MYKKIESCLILCGLSKKELAEKIEISYNTLILKLNGKNCFTLDEALLIKNILGGNDSVEDLFSRMA